MPGPQLLSQIWNSALGIRKGDDTNGAVHTVAKKVTGLRIRFHFCGAGLAI